MCNTIIKINSYNALNTKKCKTKRMCLCEYMDKLKEYNEHEQF